MDLENFRGQVLRPALTPLARIGVAEQALDIYTGVTNRYEILDCVDDSIRQFELTEQERCGYVLLPLLHSQYWETNYIYAVLAHMFRCRGYEPLIPACYDDLPHCFRKKNEPDTLGTCTNCRHEFMTLLDRFNLSPIDINDFSESVQLSDPADENLVYRDIDVSKYAVATTRRFLQRDFDLSDPHDRDVYRRLLSSGVRLVDVAYHLLESSDVSAVVAHHPNYIYGGLFLEVAHEVGVPAVSFGASYFVDQTIQFGSMSNRSPLPQFMDDDYVDEQLAEPLTDEEQERVRALVDQRRDGSALADDHFLIADADDQYAVSDDKRTVGLFTNVVWDAAVDDANLLFEDHREWLSKTIDHVGRRTDDVELVVKTHPGEQKGNQPGLYEWLETDVSLPKNVHVLPPDTEINPYRLAEDIDIGVVYASTIGIEMAYEGTPVVTVGEAHYRGHSVTFDPATKTEYFDLLEELRADSVSDRRLERAKRYAKVFFVDSNIPFPFHSHDGDDNLLPVSHDALARGVEPFDEVVDRIVNDQPLCIRQ